MSKTYRVNPETFEEAQERNYLKRKKKEEKDKRSYRQEEFPDYCTTEEDNERDE